MLILDEPANGLDPQGIRWLRDLLRSLAADGCAVLVSSHVLAEVTQTVDDVVMISGGRSVLQAPLEHMLAAHAAGVRAAGPDAQLLGELLRAEGGHVAPGGQAGIVVRDRTTLGAVIRAWSPSRGGRGARCSLAARLTRDGRKSRHSACP